MTIQIPIPDRLAREFEQAFPHEQIDVLVARLMREAIAKHQQPTIPERRRIDLVEAARRLSERMPPLSEEEFRRLRQEGRP